MGFIDILKRGVWITNRNLPAILAQIIYVIVIFAVLAVMALVVIAMFAGTIAGLAKSDLTPQNIINVVSSSVGVIFIGVLFVIIFLIVAGILSAMVEAGIYGCLIDTGRGGASRFTVKGFFSYFWKSGMSLFWLKVLIFLAAVGGMVFLGSVGVIGFAAVLIPLRDAGNNILAFAIGVPFIVVLILAALVFLFMLYGGSMLSQVSLVEGGRGAFSSVGAAYGFIKARFWDVMLFTLFLLFLLICVSVLTNVINMPFSGALETEPLSALKFLPLLLATSLLNMYASLVAQSCFVAYYLAGIAPPAPEAPKPAPVEEVIVAEFLEPEEEPGEDRPRQQGGEEGRTRDDFWDHSGGRV